MDTKLYVIPGSHPSMTARLMLEHKGIAYKRVDLISAVHKPLLRALRFSDNTVPALRIDGRRIQGTGGISRALDQIRPKPALFPADPTGALPSRRPNAGGTRRSSPSRGASPGGR